MKHVCINQVAVKFRLQISSDELLLVLTYLSSNHKPYNFWPPQDVILLVSAGICQFAVVMASMYYALVLSGDLFHHFLMI